MNKRNLLIGFFILLVPIIGLIGFLSSTSSPAVTQPNLLKSDNSIEHWRTDNGAHVYFVQVQGLPIVDIDISFASGSSRDGDKPGLASFVTRLLNKGTVDVNADQVAEQFEDAGVITTQTLDRDKISLSLRSLTESTLLDPSIKLLAELISKPAFSDNAINLVKSQTLVDLKRNLEQVDTVSVQAFYRAIYGDHPYAHPMLGTESSVANLTRADCLHFHQQFFVANNATVVIVGDLSESQAQKLAATLIDPLPSGQEAPPVEPVPALAKPVDVTIPFSSEQAHILMGQPCSVYGDKDYFPLLVGNYILGGNPLSSRLFKAVRVQKGLAYHVFSGFIEMKEAGPFVIKAETKNDQAQDTITTIKNTLNGFVKDGPTDEEIAEAKKGLINAFPLKLNSNRKILGVISDLAFYKLPLDFLNTYQEQIDDVDRDDIQSAFERRIKPEDMALVVVGDTNN